MPPRTRRKPTAKAEASVEPDPVEISAAEEPLEIPVPTARSIVWYPAIVQVPGADKARHNAKVFATPQGLYVYFAKPEDGITPDWHSEILTGQPKPPEGWRARNGFSVATAAGPVTITMGSGCGCGWPLKKWVPEFQKRVVAW
jgi:hypothetical protein